MKQFKDHNNLTLNSKIHKTSNQTSNHKSNQLLISHKINYNNNNYNSLNNNNNKIIIRLIIDLDQDLITNIITTDMEMTNKITMPKSHQMEIINLLIQMENNIMEISIMDKEKDMELLKPSKNYFFCENLDFLGFLRFFY